MNLNISWILSLGYANAAYHIGIVFITSCRIFRRSRQSSKQAHPTVHPRIYIFLLLSTLTSLTDIFAGEAASKPCTTSNPDSCCPTPFVPSQLSIFHFIPQVLASGPAPQDAAAPPAELFNNGKIVACVLGSTAIVAAIYLLRYALKLN